MMTEEANKSEFRLRISDWATAHYGPATEILNLRRMPGNSGISYGFEVRSPQGIEPLVLRLAPSGVSRKRNADVLRQVEVLQAMHAEGVPVPEVRWSSEDTRWFGVPFYAAELVRGESTELFTAGRAERCDGTDMEEVFRQAMHVLAAIHNVNWKESLPSWSEPVDIEAEIEIWTPTLMKSDDEAWISQALDVRQLLVKSKPHRSKTTVVHGDYYSNNWLFEDQKLTAVLDWEIASIGSGALDVGWACMMYDPESWGPSRHHWATWSPTAEFLASEYLSGGGMDLDDLDWYRAFAGYRLACITALNYHLHQTGRRVDPAWDILGDSLPYMLARAKELLTSQ